MSMATPRAQTWGVCSACALPSPHVPSVKQEKLSPGKSTGTNFLSNETYVFTGGDGAA